MKKQPKTNHQRARREFLRDSAVAGAGVTIAATLPGAAVADATEAAPAKISDKYQLTPHISDYYKTLG